VDEKDDVVVPVPVAVLVPLDVTFAPCVLDAVPVDVIVGNCEKVAVEVDVTDGRPLNVTFRTRLFPASAT
jgi:hypothetical protein